MSTFATFRTTYAAARSGDTAARASLVKKFDDELGLRIERIAGLKVRRWQEADDLRQSVWVAFFERLESFPHDLTEPELKGYLFKLAEWRIADAARREGKRIGESKALVQEPLSRRPSTGPATKADDHRNLERAISSLPEKLAVVLRSRLVEGKPTAEVARELGIAEPTVKQRLARARSLLDGFLKRDPGGRL